MEEPEAALPALLESRNTLAVIVGDRLAPDMLALRALRPERLLVFHAGADGAARDLVRASGLEKTHVVELRGGLNYVAISREIDDAVRGLEIDPRALVCHASPSSGTAFAGLLRWAIKAGPVPVLTLSASRFEFALPEDSGSFDVPAGATAQTVPECVSWQPGRCSTRPTRQHPSRPETSRLLAHNIPTFAALLEHIRTNKVESSSRPLSLRPFAGGGSAEAWEKFVRCAVMEGLMSWPKASQADPLMFQFTPDSISYFDGGWLEDYVQMSAAAVPGLTGVARGLEVLDREQRPVARIDVGALTSGRLVWLSCTSASERLVHEPASELLAWRREVGGDDAVCVLVTSLPKPKHRESRLVPLLQAAQPARLVVVVAEELPKLAEILEKRVVRSEREGSREWLWALPPAPPRAAKGAPSVRPAGRPSRGGPPPRGAMRPKPARPQKISPAKVIGYYAQRGQQFEPDIIPWRGLRLRLANGMQVYMRFERIPLHLKEGLMRSSPNGLDKLIGLEMTVRYTGLQPMENGETMHYVIPHDPSAPDEPGQ